ncbi:MAG: hypothetical protein LW878_04910 [Proteobacteria bacterium]|nr:hypothetical protein [Pseudomonadota bacterium]
MKCSLLSLHTSNFASRRLAEEAAQMSLSLQVIDPQTLTLSHAPRDVFDLTLNRISVVEMNEFYSALLHQKGWGRQVNSLELKLQCRDKAHQLLWLSNNGFRIIPFLCLRGKPERFQGELQAFLSHHQEWVLKMNRGQRGVGVHMLSSTAELEGWLESLWRMGDQDFLIQPRLKVRHEWRVSLIGSEFMCVLKRASREGKANAHAEQEVAWVKDPPQELRDLLEGFKRAAKFDYLALDILEDGDGLFINDLNTTMGFEQLEKITGYNIALLILNQSIRASH